MMRMEKTKTIFVETFGDSPYIRVLDFFLTFSEFDYSKSQVTQEVGISHVTIEGVWTKLIKEKFLKKTRVVGRAEMYSLDKTNTRVKELLQLDIRLSTAIVNEEQITIPQAY